MRRLLAPALLALALTAAACGSAPSQEAPTASAAGEEDTLVVALADEPDNLNPIFGDLYGTIYGADWQVFDGLLAYDQELELQPVLAAGMPEVSDDGLEVTVPLRDDVTFHDGEPFTAEDVVFTYEAMLDPDVATRLKDLLFDSVESIEAVDDTTVRFTLSRRDPAFGDKLTKGIVPAHLLEGEDLNTAAFNKAPVGTGPFVFDELRSGERMVFTANPDYFLGEPTIPRVVFAFVPDENARANQLADGSIDVDAVGLSPQIAERFRDDGAHRVVDIPGESLVIVLPNSNPVLADEEVRQAIGLAVDRQAIAEGVYAGAASPTASLLPEGHWAYDGDADLEADPAKAEALLEEAGFTEGPDGMRERDGEPLAFSLIYGAGSSTQQETALAIRSDLAEVGIDVELEGLDFAGQTERLAQGDPILNTSGNAWDPDLDLYELFSSDLADDDEAFSNPAQIELAAVDDAIAAGRETADRDERREIYVDLQETLRDDGSWQFLAQKDNVLVVSDRISGIDPQVREGHIHGYSRGLLWNLREWELGA